MSTSNAKPEPGWFVDTEHRMVFFGEAGEWEGPREYRARTHSQVFPRLSADVFAAFISRIGKTRDSDLIDEFRQWIRANLASAENA